MEDIIYACVSVLEFVYMCVGAYGGRKRALDTLEMELQAGVRLEPKLRSSARKAI